MLPSDGWATEQMAENPVLAPLLAAARALSRELRLELARTLLRMVALEEGEVPGATMKASARVRAVEALVDLATRLGRTPTTGDYKADFDERRRAGDLSRPSVNMIVRAFGSWNKALLHAGLANPARPDELRRRKGRVRLKVDRYPTARLVEALQACARDLDRTPTVLDYSAWRNTVLAQQALSHLRERDVPHWRTVYNRFGSWPAALAAAALQTDRAARAPAAGWSELA